MIELLELETIRRIGEMIKGIGSQMIDYTVKKKEQLAEQEHLDANDRLNAIRRDQATNIAANESSSSSHTWLTIVRIP